jgi:hypothetical protein
MRSSMASFWGILAGAWPDWRAGFQQGLLDPFLTEPPHSAAAARIGPALGAAQQAVEDALMAAAGSQPPLRIGQRGHSGGPSQAQITAAASRFASLSASARARLAGGPPGRPAGRHDQGGADPVIATAGVLKLAPVGTAGQLRAGVRLAWLHLRSRRVPAGILALALCGGALRAALHWHWAFSSGPYAQQIPMIIEAGAAAVIAVTSHSPFGETERATGRWLPYLRLFAAAGMCGLAIALLQLGAAGESLNQGILVLARNVTGIGLLCSLVTGGLLAWTLPIGYMAFCPVRPSPGLDRRVDLAGPPSSRPRRLDLRLRGLHGRPAPVHHPRRRTYPFAAAAVLARSTEPTVLRHFRDHAGQRPDRPYRRFLDVLTDLRR